MRLLSPILCMLLITITHGAIAQDSPPVVDKIGDFPGTFLDRVNKKTAGLEEKVVSKTEQVLLHLEKQEQKLYKKLAKKDSAAAAQLFSSSIQKYEQLRQGLTNNEQNLSSPQQYIPYLDTLKTSLNFLSQHSADLLKNIPVKDIQGALGTVNNLDSRLQYAEQVRSYMKERRQLLKDELSKLGLVKELKKYNKEVYYYSEQIKEYKSILNDPSKAERKVIELLSKTKLFQDFMRKNSMLASLFRLPVDPDDPVALQGSLAGLQTRAQVQQLIQQQISAGGPNAMAQVQQNLQQGQSQLNELKNKISQLGGGGSSDDEKLDFRPNDQKTKSFFDRVELGMNMQSTRGNNYFPVTTDLGLSVGYKVNEKSVIGVGINGKIGWGQNWQHIKFTQQGVGLRSFVDWKIKGGFYIGGGYEMNYWPSLQHVVISSPVGREITTVAWQKSGLIGVSKVVALKTKLFKNTRVQLLYDFLSYQQVPRTQPIVFRVGYAFK